MNSSCKITPGQPTTSSINTSQDQQSKETGRRRNNCMIFFQNQNSSLLVGKEGVTHFPTKWEALQSKEDGNSTHPSGRLLGNLGSQTILKLFYNFVFFSNAKKKKKPCCSEFIRAAVTFSIGFHWTVWCWSARSGWSGSGWLHLPGQSKQTKEQTSKQAIRKKKGGEKVTEGLLNTDHLTWRVASRDLLMAARTWEVEELILPKVRAIWHKQNYNKSYPTGKDHKRRAAVTQKTCQKQTERREKPYAFPSSTPISLLNILWGEGVENQTAKAPGKCSLLTNCTTRKEVSFRAHQRPSGSSRLQLESVWNLSIPTPDTSGGMPA